MTTHAEAALQRVGYETFRMPTAQCDGCPHLISRDGEPHHCHELQTILQPCPVRKREREQAERPAAVTLEEVV